MKYKVAIIGTGYMAKKHCEMLYNHNDVILDTIVSTKKSQRISKQFIQKYGFLRNTTDFDSVLEDTTIDNMFFRFYTCKTDSKIIESRKACSV